MPPKRKPPKGKQPRKRQPTQQELLRPYQFRFNKEAYTFACKLKSNKDLAKKWCPGLPGEHGVSLVDGKTAADDIFLSLVRRLGGELTPSRKKPPADADRKAAKGAAAYKLTTRAGRPNNETVVADAAAKLVQQRGEAR